MSIRSCRYDQLNSTVQVVGIDPDLERLQLAKKKYPAANIQYLEGRADDSISGQDYDVVFSNYVLHWIKDKESVFRNVNKCLKIGGKFGFVTSMGTYSTFFEDRGMLTPPEAYSPEFLENHKGALTLLTVEEHKRIASAHHFDIVMMKEGVCEFEFKNIEELVEFHMTHALGRFDRTHFNTSLLQKHYKGRKVSFKIPYVTAVLSKLQLTY